MQSRNGPEFLQVGGIPGWAPSIRPLAAFSPVQKGPIDWGSPRESWDALPSIPLSGQWCWIRHRFRAFLHPDSIPYTPAVGLLELLPPARPHPLGHLPDRQEYCPVEGGLSPNRR